MLMNTTVKIMNTPDTNVDAGVNLKENANFKLKKIYIKNGVKKTYVHTYKSFNKVYDELRYRIDNCKSYKFNGPRLETHTPDKDLIIELCRINPPLIIPINEILFSYN